MGGARMNGKVHKTGSKTFCMGKRSFMGQRYSLDRALPDSIILRPFRADQGQAPTGRKTIAAGNARRKRGRALPTLSVIEPQDLKDR